jgi:hypothetical protein
VHDERANTKPGRREDLRERPRDDDVREVTPLPDQRRPREVGVGLVDEHDRLGISLGDLEHHVIGDGVARRVVRGGEDDDLRAGRRHRVESPLPGEVVRQPHPLFSHGAARELSQPAVHRVGRMEEERAAPVAPEDEEDLQQHLVAAVAEGELVGVDAPPLLKDAPQLVSAPRIAVQQDTV